MESNQVFDTAGSLVTLDMWDIKADIFYPTFYDKFKKIIVDSGMTILNDVVHHWPNGAFTLAFILEESLASVHYYKEYNYCSFDIYTCGAANPMSIAKALGEWLRPEYEQINQHTRGVRDEPYRGPWNS